jgi:hypothetical protein
VSNLLTPSRRCDDADLKRESIRKDYRRPQSGAATGKVVIDVAGKRLAGSRPTGDNGSFTVLVAPTDPKVSTTPSSNRFGSRLMASAYRRSD